MLANPFQALPKSSPTPPKIRRAACSARRVKPYCIFFCIKVLHALGEARRKFNRVQTWAMLGLCWHYVGSFFALGRALDAFSASCCVLLPPLAGFDAFWGTPGSILAGSGTLRGGFWRSKGPIFRSFSMPLYALALQWRGCSDPYKTLAGVVQNTHRSMSAIERATQKTSKNRPNSFLNKVFC